MEGKISFWWFYLICEFFYSSKLNTCIAMWQKKPTQHLLSIMQWQWVYRNAKLHLYRLEGCTVTRHVEVMKEIKHMMLVDPSEVLTCHKKLLQADFKWLGEGPIQHGWHWLDQMFFVLSIKLVNILRSGSSRNVRAFTFLANDTGWKQACCQWRLPTENKDRPKTSPSIMPTDYPSPFFPSFFFLHYLSVPLVISMAPPQPLCRPLCKERHVSMLVNMLIGQIMVPSPASLGVRKSSAPVFEVNKITLKTITFYCL